MKFLTALGLAFIILKLCGVIAWSWWLVLLPLYFGIAALFFFLVVFIASAFGVALAGTALEGIQRARGKKKNK